MSCYRRVLSIVIRIQFIFFSNVSCKHIEEGICVKTVRIDNKTVRQTFCCSNYELKNGTCKECSVGFTSNGGDSCRSCTNNYYGYKCLSHCDCKKYQRCDHSTGCIDLQFTTLLSTPQDKTNVESSTPKLMIEDKETKNGATTEESSATKSLNVDNERKNGVWNHTIVVNTLCIAGLLVVITICYICANRFRIKRVSYIQKQSMQQIESHDQPRALLGNSRNSERNDSVYDEIDEITPADEMSSLRRHKTTYPSFSETSDSEYGEEYIEEGYINPYQPMVDDAELHEYKTAIAKSNTTSSMEFEEEYTDRPYLEIVDPFALNDLKTKELKFSCKTRYSMSKLSLPIIKYLKQENLSKHLSNKRFSL